MASAVKAKLTQPAFPFNFEEIAGTVLVGQAFDQNLQASGQQVAAEIPQAFFMQNILPIQRGFASVHYTRVVGAYTYPVYLDRVYTLRDAEGNVALYAPVDGAALIYTAATGSWVQYASPTGEIGGVVYLKGKTYVLIRGAGIYCYNFTTPAWELQTATGIGSFDDIITMVAVSSYLVLGTTQQLYYSDPLNPLLFTAAPGGAGTTGILALRGDIVTALAIAAGAIIYTTHNAILMLYSGNANVPFVFREIQGSAGVASSEHVTYDTTLAGHVAWTSDGFMQVSQQGAQLIWPELSDSIAGGIISLFGGNNYPALQKYAGLDVKCSAVGTRYIVISVRKAGEVEFGVGYVYDNALDRWGRIDIPHVDVFEYRKPEFVAAYTYDVMAGFTYDQIATKTYGGLMYQVAGKAAQFGTMFGIVNKQGAVFIALPPTTATLDQLESDTSGAATPLLCLGRYRSIRPNAVCIQEMQISNQAEGINVQWNAHDLFGDMFAFLSPMLNPRNKGQYNGRLSGAYISLSLSGRMVLTSLEFILTDAGTAKQPVRAQGSGDPLVPSNAVTIRGVPVTIGGDYVVITGV